jgi:putative PIN family toxin of toxin-antitoxin system
MGRIAQAIIASRTKQTTSQTFTSPALLSELIDILGRPKFDKKISASQLSVYQLVDRYASLAEIVRPVATPRIAPDPDDDVVIGTAIAAKATLLITGDKPLLGIVEYQGVRILSIADALPYLKEK